jgi:quercetin dioxygenase-like cupin family protein
MRTPIHSPRHSHGALTVIVTRVEPGSGPPLHRHPSLDESFYVLQGRLTFRVGDALFTALPGASVFASRGTPHAYSNQSGEAARVLVVCAPGEPESDGHVRPIHYSEVVGPPLEAELAALR